MNHYLQQQLIIKYPQIFQDVGGDPRQTPMAWGMECGDGWYDLLDTLCSMIQHHLKYNAGPDVQPVVAEQVKEKYGTLRFYYHGGDKTIDHYVQMAEAMSGRICEQCGNRGKIRGGSWLRSLCDSHAESLDTADKLP